MYPGRFPWRDSTEKARGYPRVCCRVLHQAGPAGHGPETDGGQAARNQAEHHFKEYLKCCIFLYFLVPAAAKERYFWQKI